MDFGRIRSAMEHYALTRIAVKGLRKIGFIYVLHAIQAYRKRKAMGGEDTEFIEFYNKHRSEFQEVYSIPV